MLKSDDGEVGVITFTTLAQGEGLEELLTDMGYATLQDFASDKALEAVMKAQDERPEG